jgi:hypothetical protein
LNRISGALLGALIFFLITNFGVWTLGSYSYDLKGLLLCYTLAIPFFGYSLISSLTYSFLIEFYIKLHFTNTRNHLRVNYLYKIK